MSNDVYDFWGEKGAALVAALEKGEKICPLMSIARQKTMACCKVSCAWYQIGKGCVVCHSQGDEVLSQKKAGE